jgi:hypothetical protein
VRDLKLCPLAANHGMVFTPVELEGLARAEGQGHEGAAARRAACGLQIVPPLARKGGNPIVGTGEAEQDKIGVHLLQRSLLLAWLGGFRLQPARQLLRQRGKLTRPVRQRENGLDRPGVQIVLVRKARQSRAPGNFPDRQVITIGATSGSGSKVRCGSLRCSPRAQLRGRLTWVKS